MSPADHSATFC